MVSTVQKMGLNENQNTLVIMPDTFSDYEVIKKISMKINKNQYDVVAALWVIRDDQKESLVSAKLNDLINNVDKDLNCEEKYFGEHLLGKILLTSLFLVMMSTLVFH